MFQRLIRLVLEIGEAAAEFDHVPGRVQ